MSKPRGLYRDSYGRVLVDFGGMKKAITRADYIGAGHQPSYDDLLTQGQYFDAQQKAIDAAMEIPDASPPV